MMKFLFMLFLMNNAWASEKKIWQDHFVPTLKKSIDKTGLIILGSGITSSVVVHELDKKINYYNDDHPILFDEKSSDQLGRAGNGVMGISIAVTQLFFDKDNGIRHAQALILTTLSHASIAGLVRRNRPENNTNFLPFPASYPSGHAASAFATAGSLAYSYGPKAGVPAYAAATAISLSRIRSNRHWASDIVGGAFLGTFWARASSESAADKKDSVLLVPAPVYDGIMITAIKDF
ncbi:MAG TPA: phosphatase PAP2 family protein [Bacteriovoracaceae bacterium]|nr:phosphatase PAP2 family protein [Bacteriovoracaceae bacterium]